MYQNIIERFKKLDERIDDLENYVGIGEDGSSTLLDEIKNILASINFSPIKKIIKIENEEVDRSIYIGEVNPDKCIVLINSWVSNWSGQGGFEIPNNIISYTIEGEYIRFHLNSDGVAYNFIAQLIEFN